jgi:beta-lactamase class A
VPVSRQRFVHGTAWSGRKRGLAGVPLAALLGAWLAQPGAAEPLPASAPYASPALPYQMPTSPAADRQPLTAQRALESRIRALGEAFRGDIGIAVADIDSGWTASFDGGTLFPQQSVSKFWVALTALDKADRGELSLSGPVTLRAEDKTLFHQPIAGLIDADGYTTSLADLMTRALQQSDNTANDAVLRRAGGPEAVRAFLRDKAIDGIRFGPGERLLQSRIAGIEWRQSYSNGSGFYAARNAVPLETRRAALERYIADPMDGATPLGIVGALARLKRGELLSPGSTERLLAIMSNTRTGPRRLKGGLAPGWRLAHKTGTGQVLGGMQAGYNDIGIVTSPDGRAYAVAVMIRRTSAPLGERMAVMQNTVRSVIGYHQSVQGYDMARYRGPEPSYPDDEGTWRDDGSEGGD